MAGQAGAGSGAQWFKCGWETFKPNAVNWIIITLAFVGLALVAGLVPFFGTLIFMLAMPLFIGGIYLMASGSRPVEVGGLFALFGDAAKRTPLIVVGVIQFAVSMLLSVTLGMSFVGALPEEWLTGAVTPDPQVLFDTVFNFRNLLLLAVLMLAQLVLTFGFFFAVGQVTFLGTAPLEAFKRGVQAAFANLLPLLLYGALYILLSFVAAIPFGLGFLVLLPVALLGGWCAYREVFGGAAGGGTQLTA